MIELKRLDIDNINAIIEFDKECFPSDYWKENDWKELLEDPRAIYYALLDGEKIIGNIFIYNWKGEKDYIKIMNIAVQSNYRNHGLAQKLLNHVKIEMEKIGMKRFCGETRSSNETMQKVFKKCGYVLNKIEEGYFDNPSESACKYVLEI